MSTAITATGAILAAYLLGSISFGILVATASGVDIRSAGSGNPGASNIMRVLGKKEALLVIVGDGAKGAFAAWLGAVVVAPEFGYVALLAAIIGHAYPVFHRFDGGKSVATAIGGILYLAPLTGLILAVVWLGVVIILKTASMGSILVMALLAPLLWLTGRSSSELMAAGFVAAFVLVRHASNIKRIVSSDELRITE